MSNAEFDRHAANYQALHKRNISVSGEEPAYFDDYKMRDFKALVSDAGLPLNGRYLDFGSGIGASVKPFHEHMPQARLVCADVSVESVAMSKQLHGNTVDHAWISEGKLPFDDAEFDGAFAFWACRATDEHQRTASTHQVFVSCAARNGNCAFAETDRS